MFFKDKTLIFKLFLQVIHKIAIKFGAYPIICLIFSAWIIFSAFRLGISNVYNKELILIKLYHGWV